MSEPPPPPLNPPDSGTSPGTTALPRNIAAGLACLFTLVGGIVFLVLEKKDRFVRFWAMQATLLGGLAIAVPIVLRIAAVIFDFIPLVGKLLLLVLWLANLVFGLGWFVLYAVTVIKAFSNQEWEIPWLGALARKQLAKMDGPAEPPPV